MIETNEFNGTCFTEEFRVDKYNDLRAAKMLLF
jgi:hypothetical protein